MQTPLSFTLILDYRNIEVRIVRYLTREVVKAFEAPRAPYHMDQIGLKSLLIGVAKVAEDASKRAWIEDLTNAIRP